MNDDDDIEVIEMSPEQARAHNEPLIQLVQSVCLALEERGYAAEALLTVVRFCVINYALILDESRGGRGDGIPSKASVKETLGMLAGLLRMNGDM
jgi:hypothetical protein